MSKYVIEKQAIIKEDIEILPCPFCGKENTEVVYRHGDYGYSSSKAYVKCRHCGSQGAKVTDDLGSFSKDRMEKIAITNWNVRDSGK